MNVQRRFHVFKADRLSSDAAGTFTLPPQQKTYRLVALAGELTTDATAGNRVVFLHKHIPLGNGVFIRLGTWRIKQAFSTTEASVSFTFSSADPADTDAQGEYSHGSIPQDLVIEPGERLQIVVQDAGVNESLANIYLTVKWLEKLSEDF